jgi:hypothetical protein
VNNLQRFFIYLVHAFRLTTVYGGFLLLLALCVPRASIGADDEGKYRIYGYGTHACGQFVEARKKSHDAPYSTWITGYLTAFNKQPSTFSILGTTALDETMEWVEQYCTKHPRETLAEAAEALVLELYPKRITQESK